VLILLCRLIQIYALLVFGRVIISWFPISPGSFLASVNGFLYTVTEPVLGPVRRVIPPLGVGGMGLDLSPIVVFFAIQIVLGIIC
jgi:YggT family protein